MKKVALGIMVVAVLLSCGVSFAASNYTANVSSAIVTIAAPATSSTIVFPFTSRNVYLRNYDSRSCWIAPKGNTTGTENVQTKIFLGDGASIDLLDFATDTVTVHVDNKIRNLTAVSSIVVTATY